MAHHLVRASPLGLCRPEYRGFKSRTDHQFVSVHLLHTVSVYSVIRLLALRTGQWYNDQAVEIRKKGKACHLFLFLRKDNKIKRIILTDQN